MYLSSWDLKSQMIKFVSFTYGFYSSTHKSLEFNTNMNIPI